MDCHEFSVCKKCGKIKELRRKGSGGSYLACRPCLYDRANARNRIRKTMSRASLESSVPATDDPAIDATIHEQCGPKKQRFMGRKGMQSQIKAILDGDAPPPPKPEKSHRSCWRELRDYWDAERHWRDPVRSRAVTDYYGKYPKKRKVQA